MAYDNELKGVLFKNEEKETDKHPDYKGSATIEGIDYFLDAWINTAETGRKYMSLRLNPKKKQQTKGASVPPPATQSRTAAKSSTGTGFDDMDDDIPF